MLFVPLTLAGLAFLAWRHYRYLRLLHELAELWQERLTGGDEITFMATLDLLAEQYAQTDTHLATAFHQDLTTRRRWARRHLLVSTTILALMQGALWYLYP
jgi:hypothetical protein